MVPATVQSGEISSALGLGAEPPFYIGALRPLCARATDPNKDASGGEGGGYGGKNSGRVRAPGVTLCAPKLPGLTFGGGGQSFWQ